MTSRDALTPIHSSDRIAVNSEPYTHPNPIVLPTSRALLFNASNVSLPVFPAFFSSFRMRTAAADTPTNKAKRGSRPLH